MENRVFRSTIFLVWMTCGFCQFIPAIEVEVTISLGKGDWRSEPERLLYGAHHTGIGDFLKGSPLNFFFGIFALLGGDYRSGFEQFANGILNIACQSDKIIVIEKEVPLASSAFNDKVWLEFHAFSEDDFPPHQAGKQVYPSRAWVQEGNLAFEKGDIKHVRWKTFFDLIKAPAGKKEMLMSFTAVDDGTIEDAGVLVILKVITDEPEDMKISPRLEKPKLEIQTDPNRPPKVTGMYKMTNGAQLFGMIKRGLKDISVQPQPIPDEIMKRIIPLKKWERKL